MGREALHVRSTSSQTWLAFNAAFDDNRGCLDERITAEMSELPSYREMSRVELRPHVERGLNGFRTVLVDRRSLTKDELRLYWSVTKGQADFGVTLQDSRTAWHLGLDILCGWVREEIARELQPREVLVDFLELSVSWWRQGSDAATECYRWLSTAEHVSRNVLVEELFSDIASARFGSGVSDRFAALGLDPDAQYYAMRTRLTGAEEVGRFRTALGIDADPAIGEVALLGDQVWAVVRELPAERFTFPVGFAPPASCGDLTASFREAGRALKTATTLNQVGVHGLDSVGVHSAVMLDHAVGDALLARYVEPVLAVGRSGADVLVTVRSYINNHLSFDRAAADLFVHPNTVRYRVRRFEQETGVSLRDNSTFIAVWWALERYRLRRS
ncbi:PucR family transcriptional regulator [Cryptosporangium sp. NPDC048952]|uniref:PucR family transcriptional regulator n=1 Tax=Cryptosporangium sp. NPDC048952 TaxID=3363961 RepID=UPI00371F2EBA